MSENKSLDRRKVLQLTGVGAVGGLAGCLGGGNGNGNGGNGNGDGGSDVPQVIETQYRNEWDDSRSENVERYDMPAEPGATVQEIPIEYSSEDSEWLQEFALQAQRGLNQLGFQSTLIDNTVQALLEGWLQAATGNPFSYLTHGPDPQRGVDPDPLLARRECGFTQNYANYCNPEATELIQEEQSTLDPEARQEVLNELQIELANDHHQIVPLFPDIQTVVNTSTWEGHVVMPGNGASLDSFPWTAVNVQPLTDDRTYVKGGGQPVNHLNIAWGVGGAGEKRMRYAIDGLFDVSPSMETIPGLALGAEAIDDSTIEVELRDGVEWHDGEPFGPDDVVFSTEMFIEHESPQMSVFTRNLNQDNPVEIVSEDGGGVIQFNLTQPSAVFTTVGMVRSVIYPRHVWSEIDNPAEHEPSTMEEGAMGTGPFRLANWEQGTRLELERHDNNWMWDDEFRQEHLGDQYVEGEGAEAIVWTDTGNIDSAIGALQEGEIDAINQRVTTSQADTAADHEDVEKRISNNYAPLHGMTDFTIPLIRDKEFRRAYIGRGIDVQGFVDSVLGGNAIVPNGNNPVYPEGPFYNDDTPSFEYNPERANQILDQAGYGTDGGTRTYPEGDAWAAFVERVRNPSQTREDLGQPDFS